MKIINEILPAIIFACLISGCKLAVLVPQGGSVQSLSGTRNCLGPRYCEFEINDGDFSETFTAVPRPGFEFVKWQKGDGFFCGNSTDPVCAVSLPGGAAGDSIVASFAEGSIRPLFRSHGVDTDGDGTVNEIDTDDDNDGRSDDSDDCPLDGPNRNGLGCPSISDEEMVLVGDKYWAQLQPFPHLSWDEINAACPASTGICFGKIGDVDVTGWTWASGNEVTALLNAFLGTELGAVPDRVEVLEWITLSPYIFNYFWPQDDQGALSVYGWIREEANLMEGYVYGVRCAAAYDPNCYELRAGAFEFGNPLPKSLPYGKVWLYRLE